MIARLSSASSVANSTISSMSFIFLYLRVKLSDVY
jgi:hypothetical protein